MQMDNIQITEMTESDLESLSPILETEFDNFWTINTLKSEMENSNSTVIIAKRDSEILGFAGIWKAVDVMHIMDIVVAKKYRRQHIGKALLEKLIELTIQNNIYELTLEVRQDNIPAIYLYTKYNFQKIGERKNYYGANNNAIIMTLYIDKKIKEEFPK